MNIDTAREHFFLSGILYGHYHIDKEHNCPHGHVFWNYPSGIRMVEGCYNSGIRSGLWRWFGDNGKFIKKTEFGDGEYKKTTFSGPLNLSVCSPDNTILLDEEWGFRQWLWLPDRPLDEIMIWWQELDAISPWYLSPWPLPGVIVEAIGDLEKFWHLCRDTRQYVTCHLNEDDDSNITKLTGEQIFHKNYDLVKQEGIS